jgi:hypothetical protein
MTEQPDTTAKWTPERQICAPIQQSLLQMEEAQFALARNMCNTMKDLRFSRQ